MIILMMISLILISLTKSIINWINVVQGQQKRAINHYAALNNTQKPVFCQSCRGHCTQACPYGLQVKEQLLKAHKLLTV